MEFSFSKVGTIVLGVLSFIRLVNNTLIGQFLRWFPFGLGWLIWFLDFVVKYYEYLAGVTIAFIFLKWTKNFYILLVIAILVILFLKFGLKAVGVA